MLPSFSRGLRLALVLALGASFVGWQGHGRAAYAADDEEESSDEEDDGSSDDVEESDEQEDKDQPPVTAGGLFTLSSYPVNELLRPLTITQRIAQIRLGLGTDVSSLGAFSTAGVSLEGQYGVTDNFMVIGGFTSAYNFNQFSFYGGFEGALLYDLVDIRLAANIQRAAIPVFCTDTMALPDPAPDGCTDPMDPTVRLPLPSGEYNAGDLKASLDIGFPFRYALKPEIAIIALQTLMSIDANEASGNKVTPDLKPSVGVATNPIPQLSLFVFAQLRVIDFNTDAGNFQVPVTGRVSFSPNQKLDLGLEFTLLNVKPPEPQKPFDNRFLSLFLQTRFGK